MADESTVEENRAEDSALTESTPEESTPEESTIEESTIEESTIEESTIEESTIEESTIEESTIEEINDKYYLDNKEDIYGALSKIILMKQPVFITIEGSDETFTSAITHANLKNSSFLLDQVAPLIGNDLIRTGSRFSVLADSHGVKIEFDMTGRINYQPTDQQYRVEFPTQVLYLQRRTAYRVMIPPAHQILVKLKMEDEGEHLVGQLADISSSGFKALFKGDCLERLKNTQDIPIARIRFNDQNTMDCSLIARHVIATKNGDTQAGFAFNLISGIGQRFLDRLVGELQWEERQQAEQVKLKNNEKLPNLPS
ncbi:MAG: c-di-GMP-binding flagellar brake protein YcgR [Oleispira sp.]|jgi:c-di-GMP-binding flagellar brake protein YcgR